MWTLWLSLALTLQGLASWADWGRQPVFPCCGPDTASDCPSRWPPSGLGLVPPPPPPGLTWAGILLWTQETSWQSDCIPALEPLFPTPFSFLLTFWPGEATRGGHLDKPHWLLLLPGQVSWGPSRAPLSQSSPREACAHQACHERGNKANLSLLLQCHDAFQSHPVASFSWDSCDWHWNVYFEAPSYVPLNHS